MYPIDHKKESNPVQLVKSSPLHIIESLSSEKYSYVNTYFNRY